MTKTNTHTPGPWKFYNRLKAEEPSLIIATDLGTARLPDGATKISGVFLCGDSTIANARLIASAPALLEALEKTNAELIRLAAQGIVNPGVLHEARAALKLAKP